MPGFSVSSRSLPKRYTAPSSLLSICTSPVHAQNIIAASRTVYGTSFFTSFRLHSERIVMPVFFSRYPSKLISREPPPVNGRGMDRSGDEANSRRISTTVSDRRMNRASYPNITVSTIVSAFWRS